MSEIKELKDLKKEWLELKNPATNIYYKGDLSLLDYPKVAIIGSRKMNLYTKNLVFELGSKLSRAQICVVSGGALGVDIAAASAAMPLTIGIFANSLDLIYPKTNEKIIKQIYEQGLALSEHKANYQPQGHDFLLRNRLIISLCEHIIIAQADLQSGSMQSARLANELGKKIFVLPQRMSESRGTNKLLAEQKACLINDIDAFVREISGRKDFDKGSKDEILDFCKEAASLEKALALFGTRIYEYELQGKIAIEGPFIRALG